MNDKLAETLCKQIEGFFGDSQCFLLAKGRVGLYAGLLAMNLPRGSKVIMPGYTCMVVPLAVQAAELEPVYVDIDPSTYNLDLGLLEQAMASDTTALIVQHTYGIPCDMPVIQPSAASRRIPIIEDCCHTFGARVRGQLCGRLGAFAFMSGQWNKPFSTGLGGILLVNDPSLAERVHRIVREKAHQPGLLRNLMLRIQIAAFELLVKPRTAARITRLYRALTKYGLVIGSSSAKELRGTLPERYFSTMAACQIRKGIREMGRIEENIRHRTRLSVLYSQRLPELGFAPVEAVCQSEVPLLRYPVRVANKKEVLEAAVRRGVEIGSWFEVPLHPEGTRMEDFGYRLGSCPESEAACREVVNLPTHMKVSEATASKTLQFLGEWARPA